MLLPWIDHPNITAVLFAGLPGQESGNSLVDVLYGEYNPSGRLPYTIANSPLDYPANVIYDTSDPILEIPYREGLYIDYRWFDYKNIEPTFPFGFGLSYTHFKYSKARVSISEAYVIVTVHISNDGNLDGHEVAQLYLGFPPSAKEPPKVRR